MSELIDRCSDSIEKLRRRGSFVDLDSGRSVTW